MGKMQNKKADKKKKDSAVIVKGTKKNVAPRDPNGPRLPISPFLFFCREWRFKIKAANPDALIPEQNKLLGSKWKEISEDDRRGYRHDAQADRDRYNTEMIKYRAKKAAEESQSQNETTPRS